MNREWYERPVLAFFVFLILTCLFVFAGRTISFGESNENRYIVYAVKFEYFGMDSSEMERLITIPLEEKLMVLPDLLEMRSVSEYSKSNVSVYFSKTADRKKLYLSLREIVDTLYAELPSAVQKPGIYSSDTDQKAVLNLALLPSGNDSADFRTYAENDLKKKMEAIDGVSEVIVSGGSIEEIRVEFDTDRIVEAGLNPSGFGSIIQDANVISPKGVLHKDRINDVLIFDTKIRDLEEIKDLPVLIDDEMTEFKYLADVSIKNREQDEIVRVNGKEAVGISIKKSCDGNSISISKKVQKLLAASRLSESDYTILYDTGAVLEKMIRDVIISILISFVSVIIIIPFFFNSSRTVLLLLLMICTICVWTVGELALAGLSLNQNTLSGVSIALGLVVDSALVIATLTESRLTRERFIGKVKRVNTTIVAASLTTMIVLVPLYFMDSIVPGVKNIVITIVFMLINAIILSCFFLPCFIYTEKTHPVLPKKVPKRFSSAYIRLSYRTTAFSLRHGRQLKCLYAVCIGLPLFLFLIAGKNISLAVNDTVLYAVAEFEPEKNAAVIDREMKEIIEQMQQEQGVTFIRTEARKGAMDIEIGYDSTISRRTVLAEKIGVLGKDLYDGYLYVPDTGSTEKKKTHEIEIAVVGDESEKCREIAKEALGLLNQQNFVVQSVLNFKNPETTVFFEPDTKLLSKNGITVETIAMTLRWLLFGPVVDKWLQNGNEMDIRVIGTGFRDAHLAQLSNIHVPSSYGSIRLTALGKFSFKQGDGKIYRKDGRRCAYFTVHTNNTSTDAAISAVSKTLSHLNVDRGYGFSLSRDLEVLSDNYRTLFFSFIAAIVGILILLTALSENPLNSLKIVSVIPVSVLLPLLIKLTGNVPLEMGDIVGMVLLSGISVNNAIYIAESEKNSMKFKVREKIKCIYVSSLTSIAGAVPLYIICKSSFSGELAFFMIWGVFSSVLISIVCMPTILQSKSCEKRKKGYNRGKGKSVNPLESRKKMN